MSPILTGIVHQAFELVFSEEGCTLRQQLIENINLLRNVMAMRGLIVSGTPSPIVPVFTAGKSDDEALGRVTALNMIRNGLHANLVEFPAVPRGKARFRFQVMATHEEEEIQKAAEIMVTSRMAALEELQQLSLSDRDHSHA